MKHSIIALVVLIVLGFGVFYFIQSSLTSPEPIEPVAETPNPSGDDPMPVEPDGGIGDGAEPLTEVDEAETTLGNSIKGTSITAYNFGSGDTEIVFVGGIHGGYSWNTALLGYQLVDYFEANEESIPENVRVSVIPVLNPDGLERVTGKTGRFAATDVSGNTTAGRFNSNDVDLNRNFDCEWEAEGTWRSQTVSGGSEPFSEPETSAFRKFIRETEPAAVVAYYSAAGGVYASNCNNGVLPETTKIMNIYADASGYEAYQEFDFYQITGDMVNWLAKENIPGISVLLTDHENTERTKNIAGVEALLASFAE